MIFNRVGDWIVQCYSIELEIWPSVFTDFFVFYLLYSLTALMLFKVPLALKTPYLHILFELYNFLHYKIIIILLFLYVSLQCFLIEYLLLEYWLKIFLLLKFLVPILILLLEKWLSPLKLALIWWLMILDFY